MSNNENDIFIRLRKILARFMKMQEEMIKPESLLREDLGVDSIDIWEIICKVEEEFHFEVPEGETPQVNTVQDVVKIIEEKIQR